MPDEPEAVKDPPRGFLNTLKHLGPGMILAGSIVGSGELIATTATGGKAGFSFLWLIIIGCAIKVFVQIELGRHSITHGKTTLDALNDIPGPKLGPLNLFVWFWLLMFLAGLGQLGGIIGGVGQALSISAPLTADGKFDNQTRAAQIRVRLIDTERSRITDAERGQALEEERATYQQAADRASKGSRDDKWWAVIIGTITMFMLVRGTYGFIQIFCTVLVISFTFITIGNLFALQGYEAWAVSGSEILHGLSFSFPEAKEGGKPPLMFALATFGIIGVGSAELVAYPYWCLEKGYAKWTGEQEDSEAWASRARGWLRVMKIDAWGAMAVYTFSTVAFYLLGAAILGRTGMEAKGTEMIRVLATLYAPVFGDQAQTIFLIGAFAVLYSTFFSAIAAKCRLAGDALILCRLVDGNDRNRKKWIRVFGVLLPLICILIYVFIPAPVKLILISGIMQALLLPVLAVAALYYRYKQSDDRLGYSRVFDVMLWISFACFTVIGIYIVLDKLGVLEKLGLY